MSAHTNPGTYPGNPALPREVKDKILSTFRHTLNLFHEGKIDDCVIGCDFILKMDARFAPARQLLDKAKNPNANVDVSQLEAIVATTPTRQERVVAADPDRLLVRAVESYNARDFDAAIAASEQVLRVLPGNQDALEILDKSEKKKAAQPVFDGSRQRALAALAADRKEDARAELAKMRELDPDHPAVALLERRIGPAGPPSVAAVVPPPPPDFGGLSLDSGDQHRGFGAMQEPDIRFDDGATVALKIPPPPPPPAPAPSSAGGADGLDSLSLDSLSLDLPPPMPEVTPPSAEPRPALGGPLAGRTAPKTGPVAVPPAAPPLPPPPQGAYSPDSMWSGESGGNLDLDSIPSDGPSMAPPSFSAPEPPPAPASVSYLEPEDSGPSADAEIAALLRQGDEVARRGEREQAIEIWSRIFLIDINNSEAVTRIERARQEMTEGNRKISDGLKSGREKYEAGDLNGARELFLEVLAIDENEPTARFYLDRIQEELAHPGRPAESAATEPAPAAEGAAPGRRGAAAQAESAAKAAPSRGVRLPVSSRALLLVAGFVVMVVALVYFFVLRAPKPVPGPAPTARRGAPAPGGGSLAQARQLLGAGKIGEARQELRRVPPSSPDFAEAQRMLNDLGKSGPEGGAGGPETVAGQPSGQSPVTSAEAEAARLRATAETALAQKRYIDAMKSFSQAAPAFKNDPTFAQSMGVAADKVAVLTPAVKLYNEGEYETAIPVLWRIFQEDRDNQDAKSYLLRAYFNQGITLLQNGLYPKAIQAFDEALALDPADAEIIRHKKFAERYLKSDLDLMGRIYVRHLNHRP